MDSPPPRSVAAIFASPREQLRLDVGVLQHRHPGVAGVIVQPLLLLLWGPTGMLESGICASLD